MMRSPGPAFDLRAAMSQELSAAIEELDASGGRPKGVHRCRVHIKRARALARVGRVGAPGLAQVFNDSARGVMRTLGQARDLVALSEAARRAAKKGDNREAEALQNVAYNLDAERGFLPSLDIEGARTGLKDLLALAQVWPEASHRQIKRGAERVIRRARKARRRGRGSDEPARRHEWRKREKDRFYAALLLDDAWPTARRLKLGERLGEVLGVERDALLLIDRIEADRAIAGEGKAAKHATRVLRRRCVRFADRADALGARVHSGGA
jgi:CHAD domain-containing protein